MIPDTVNLNKLTNMKHSFYSIFNTQENDFMNVAYGNIKSIIDI